jgi:NAD(P)H-nitrite reductase large subunit
MDVPDSHNLVLTEPLGLDTDKGVMVDGHLRTNQPDIYAAGDVAGFRGMPYSISPAAMEQGKIAGINMANTLKVVGIDLAFA